MKRAGEFQAMSAFSKEETEQDFAVLKKKAFGNRGIMHVAVQGDVEEIKWGLKGKTLKFETSLPNEVVKKLVNELLGTPIKPDDFSDLPDSVREVLEE